MGEPQTIVVGYDGSDCARAALDAAVELARSTGDRIVIGFGYEPPGYGEDMGPYRAAVRRHGEQVAAEAVARAAEAGVAAEVELVADSPARALEALADRHHARLIVIGSYGEGVLRSAILGSTPHKLVHKARQPVLVVPQRRGENP